jgi:hypothetical protein
MKKKLLFFNIIRNMDTNLKDYKLLSRIFKHSTPNFISKVENIISNNKIRGFNLY